MNIALWMEAARPKTLIASVSPVLIGAALTWRHLDWLIFLATLGASLTIQIGTNLANDYFDFLKGADTPQRKGPIRLSQTGVVPLPMIRRSFLYAFGLSLLCSLPLIARGGIPIALLAALSVALGILYTAGPLPLAYVGLGDLFAFLFFGPIAVAATAFLESGVWSGRAALAGCAPGLICCAILTINNLRDVQEDKSVGKKTVVVRWGTGWGKCEYLACMALPFCIALFFLPWGLLTLVAFPVAYRLVHALYRVTDAAQYNVLLAHTGQFLLFFTLLFCLGLAL